MSRRGRPGIATRSADAGVIDAGSQVQTGRWWSLRRWGNWLQRGPRIAIVVFLAGLVSLATGVMTANFDGSLGPHEARYSMTANGEVTVDLGPLGALILESPVPILGIDVHVGEIPAELNLDQGSIGTGLVGDLDSYLQFFSNPGSAIEQARDGLISDALARTVLIWSLILASISLGHLATRGQLAIWVRHLVKEPPAAILSGALAAVLAAVGVHTAVADSQGAGRTVDALAGTPLEEARITGRLGDLIGVYSPVVVSAVEDNLSFYSGSLQSLQTRLARDRTLPEPLLPAQRSSWLGYEGEELLTNPVVDPLTVPRHASVLQQHDAEPDEVNLVVVSDLHCNVGMAQLIEEVVVAADAEVLVNLGDTVSSGTSVESTCVDSFARAWNHAPVVVADGNHDSIQTAQQERDAGWHVLDGEPVEVAGIRFLGDTDPTLTGIGIPTHSERDETVLAMGERLAETGCDLADAGTPVDILAVHQAYAGRQILEYGCAPLSMSGHFHRQVGPWHRGWGWQYVSASSAGATGSLTVGPLQEEAAITVLRWDRANRVPVAYKIVRIGTEGETEVTPWISFGDPPAHSVTPVEPAGVERPWG